MNDFNDLENWHRFIKKLNFYSLKSFDKNLTNKII